MAEPIEPSLVDFVLLQRKLNSYLANPIVGTSLSPYEVQTFLALYDDYFGLNGKILISSERDGYLSVIASLPRFGDAFLNLKMFFSILRDPETSKWAIVLDDAEFVRFASNIGDDAFERLLPEEEIVGDIDEFNVPPILNAIANITTSVEFRRGELFLNCQHPLTQEGIEPPRVVDEKPWDRLKSPTDEVIVTDAVA